MPDTPKTPELPPEMVEARRFWTWSCPVCGCSGIRGAHEVHDDDRDEHVPCPGVPEHLEVRPLVEAQVLREALEPVRDALRRYDAVRVPRNQDTADVIDTLRTFLAASPATEPEQEDGPVEMVYEPSTVSEALTRESAARPGGEGADTTEGGKYGRNFREAIEHIHKLPPSERSAMSNRAASSSPSEEGVRARDALFRAVYEVLLADPLGHAAASVAMTVNIVDAAVAALRERLTSDDFLVKVAASSVLDQPETIAAMAALGRDCAPDAEVLLLRRVLAVVADHLEQREGGAA